MDLQDVAKKVGSTITREQYDAEGRFSEGTLRKRFGGWLAALRKAGLKATVNLNITEDELLENMESVWLNLGRQPRRGEMELPLSRYTGTTYERRCGGWTKALQHFVDTVNQIDTVDIKEIIVSPIASNIQDDTRLIKHKTKREPNLRLRWQVYKRDNFRCVACGRTPAKDSSIELHIDHILAWVKGGETVIENLRLLCSDCNLGKSDGE